jgi:hypothetical protein
MDECACVVSVSDVLCNSKKNEPVLERDLDGHDAEGIEGVGDGTVTVDVVVMGRNKVAEVEEA